MKFQKERKHIVKTNIMKHPASCASLTYSDNLSDELHSDYFSFDDGSLKNNTEELTMICKHPESKTFHVYLIFTFVIGFVIPFFIITVCYIMILARLLRPSEARARSKQVSFF